MEIEIIPCIVKGELLTTKKRKAQPSCTFQFLNLIINPLFLI
jgi:hypothetical protein